MNTFNELLQASKACSKKTIAVACAHDLEVIEALELAQKEIEIDSILVGDQEKIEEIITQLNGEISNYEIINELDDVTACEIAVKKVSSGQADVVMKGLVDTSKILKAVLNKEFGLRTGKVLSHVAVFEVQGYDRLIYVSDAAMNIAPTLEQKIQIIENSVQVANGLGNDSPIVAMLAAVEKVNDAMPATLDAAEIVSKWEAGEIKNCRIGGPYALDNAVSMEAVKHKGMTDPLAGQADILLVPNIESGNILYKSLTYFANANSAGIIMGASAPIVLTSRADSAKSKMLSIAISKLISDK